MSFIHELESFETTLIAHEHLGDVYLTSAFTSARRIFLMSNRRLLDIFKMFMIYNVCKTDICKTSARRL